MTNGGPPGSRHPRLFWMPILVLALGAGSILLLLANNRIQNSLIAPDTGSLRAVAEIQTRITVAHLWIEEYVSGDEVDLDEIERSLNRAARLATSLQERAAPSAENAPVMSPEDSTIQSFTVRIGGAVQRFGRLTRERRAGFDAGADVRIGSEVDINYDRAFASLHDDLDGLERALILRLTASEHRARVVFRGLVIAWSLIVMLAAVGLWTRERRQLMTESALGDSQAQLLQAQKMEAVGRLAGGLAHDINNYLAAIASQSELVRMKAEPGSTTANRMDAVLATTRRAGALIERLLAFSRRQPARPEALDINDVLESVDEMLRQLLGEDIQLEMNLQPGLWPVVMDTAQLEQVILNLAVNAREAMSTGGALTIATENIAGHPTVRRRRGAGPNDWVALTVSDTGSGIPEPLRRKIFDPFFTTKEKTHSGLGLATVLGVVEQNGGQIEVHSNEGGSRFEVLLPRSSDEPAARSSQKMVNEVPRRESGRILLVEDNDEVRRSTRDLLTNWGYRVTAAAGGDEAISVFQRKDGFDLLITDVVMPGLSGRQVAEKVRAVNPALPVLYMSGHTDDIMLRHGLESGDVDLLPKPFSARELAERVRAALSAGD